MTRNWNLVTERDTATAPPPRRRRSRANELQIQVERILERSRLAVVYAGKKNAAGAVINETANLRPWKSYETVAHDIAGALGRLGCRHVAVIPEDMRLGERLRDEGIHMVWLNSGGVQGYDSVAHGAAMLEMFGIPYIGHAPLAAALLDNKYMFKRLLTASGIPTAPCIVWQPGDERFQPDASFQFQWAFKDWTGEFIVKPVSGRASLHVHHVASRKELAGIIESVQELTGGSVLVEGYLPGREYCVAVCGHVIRRNGMLERNDGPFAFACVERVLGEDEKVFTSMDVSPITTDRLRMLLAADDADIVARLHMLARQVFNESGLETLIRLDVRMGADGELYVLEGNPKPDLKAPQENMTSIICAGIAHEGMSFDDLIFSLLADKVDLMFAERRPSVKPLAELAELAHNIVQNR